MRRLFVLPLLLVAIAVQPARASSAPNDDWANRTVIGSLPFSDTVDATQLTAEPGEFVYCGTDESVWYELTPASDTLLVLDTQGSSFRASIGVYAQQDATFPAESPRCWSPGDLGYAEVRLPLTANTHFYFQISPQSGEEPGTLQVNARLGSYLPNDDFADALVITSLPFHTDATGFLSSEPGEPRECDTSSTPPFGGAYVVFEQSAWYRFTPAHDTILHVGDAWWGAAVYTGSELDGLTRVACISQSGTIELPAGTSYSIQLAGYDPASPAPLTLTEWREVVLADLGPIQILPEAPTVARVTGRHRDDDPAFYDITIEASDGPTITRSINALGTELPEFDLPLPPPLVVRRLTLRAWFNPADRVCLTDAGPGTPCTLYAPGDPFAWAGTEHTPSYLIIDVEGRLGNTDFARRLAVPGAGQLLAVEPTP